MAIVCVTVHSEEGWDRKDFKVSEAQELVSALRGQSPDQKIVVVASVPGAVTTEWLEDADALLVLFMPGEQVGPALAAMLTGKSAPGGRLPVSFPKPDEKRFSSKQYPGECPPPKYWCPELMANFSEGVLVGYRWNDAMDVPSAFPFGFGLSYTEFKFKDIEVKCAYGKSQVTLNVSNVGDVDGTAVPQLYVGFPSLKPVKRQLRGFQKVQVSPGKMKPVGFALSEEDWRYYDEAKESWVFAPEDESVIVSVGYSSADLVWHHVLPRNCAKETKKKQKSEIPL